jgi:hypothetical protein
MTDATADAARPGAAGTDTERRLRVQAIAAAVLERIRAAGVRARRARLGYAATDRFPDCYRDRPTMIFRPYRYDGAIAYDAIRMGDASTADALVAEMFSDPEIEFVHTRNVHAGCHVFALTRADP